MGKADETALRLLHAHGRPHAGGVIPGALGDVAGAVETVLSDVLDMNGDVEIGPDTGEVGAQATTPRASPCSCSAAGRCLGARAAAGTAARVGFDRTGPRSVGSHRLPPSLLGVLDDLPRPIRPTIATQTE